LRLINAAAGSEFRFWIEGHNITIVARDSYEIMPVTVSHVHLHIAQRYDLIVTCNQDPSVAYPIYVAGRNNVLPSGTLWTKALLTYPGSKVIERFINMDEIMELDPDEPYFDYEALRPLKPHNAPAVDRRITLEFHRVTNSSNPMLDDWVVNNISFNLPKEPLIQGNLLDGKLDNILADEYVSPLNTIQATHIHHLEYGRAYEVLLINRDPFGHPWHIHGYSVGVVAAGAIPSGDLDAILPRLNSKPPVLLVGDTFTVPGRSYVAFRFTADNPGPWLSHCHITWHNSPGLGVVFSVGRRGRYRGLVQRPPDNFRMCGPRLHLE